MDESIQADDLITSPSSPPRVSSAAPPFTVVESTLTFLLGSHSILTRDKTSIFKTCHLTNLAVLGSSGLLMALLASA